MIARFLASVGILLLFSPALLAQTEAGGNCDLSVSVRASDERSIETQVQIELLSSQGIVLGTVHIIGAEPAQFRVSNARTYRLRVSGGGIETLNTSYFEINALEQVHS